MASSTNLAVEAPSLPTCRPADREKSAARPQLTRLARWRRSGYSLKYLERVPMKGPMDFLFDQIIAADRESPALLT
jgi:hypothetical protein